MGAILAIVGWMLLMVVGGFAFLILMLALGRQSHDGLSFWERFNTPAEEVHARRQAYRLKATLFWMFGAPAIIFGGVALVYGILILLANI